MHTIRLRGPWQLQPLERYVKRGIGGYESQASDLPPRDRAKMPADWSDTLGHDFLGVVRYSRNFNRPTNLEPQQRVWLVVEPPRSCGLVRVNGHLLGHVRVGAPTARFDVTSLLKDNNAIEIDVQHPELDDNRIAPDERSSSVTGGLAGEVRLEIDD